MSGFTNTPLQGVYRSIYFFISDQKYVHMTLCNTHTLDWGFSKHSGLLSVRYKLANVVFTSHLQPTASRFMAKIISGPVKPLHTKQWCILCENGEISSRSQGCEKWHFFIASCSRHIIWAELFPVWCWRGQEFEVGVVDAEWNKSNQRFLTSAKVEVAE